jgi:hypothetical protein
MFGGRFVSVDPDGAITISRSNFDSFLPGSTGFGAFITVFQVTLAMTRISRCDSS